MSSVKTELAKLATDSIPRIQLPDLFIALREFEQEPVRTLEQLRLDLGVELYRKITKRGRSG